MENEVRRSGAVGVLVECLSKALPEQEVRECVLRAFADAPRRMPLRLMKGREFKQLLGELKGLLGDLPEAEEWTEPAALRPSERALRASHCDPIYLLVRYLRQVLCRSVDDGESAATKGRLMRALDDAHGRCEGSALLCKWIAHTKFDHGMYCFDAGFDVRGLDPGCIAALHDKQWLKGQAPSIGQIRAVLQSEKFITFVLNDRSSGTLRPVVVMHATSVEKGETIRAGDILHDARDLDHAVPDQPVGARTLVFFAVSSAVIVSGAHLAQWVITDQIMPWVRSHRELRHMAILTSSPMSYWPAVARRMASGAHRDQFRELVALVDRRVSAIRLGGFDDLKALLRTAHPHLCRTGNLPKGLLVAEAEEPMSFLAKLFSWLPTHDEIFAAPETERAHRVRITRFFTTPRDAPDLVLAERERAAAILLMLTCAVITQAGVFEAGTGATLDRIARFHLANGARYAPMLPLMASRPRDLAAWMFGQILEYPLHGPEDWNYGRVAYAAECEERRQRWQRLRADGLDMGEWRIVEAGAHATGEGDEPTVGIDLTVAVPFIETKLDAIAGLAPSFKRGVG